MPVTQLRFAFDAPPVFAPMAPATLPEKRPQPSPATLVASGEKSKARDIIAAIRTLKAIEQEQRLATPEEKQILARFSGFGPVALSIFPDPVTGKYKNAGWETIGGELKTLLSPAEYESAKRTTFNAFYTSPIVIEAMHSALGRLGVPDDALVLEPGCGSGNFMASAPKGKQFIGVELDSISGRIAKARFPGQQIRIENFRDSVLPNFDAVIGNVPFADLKLDHQGQKFSLHDYFFAKSVDHLAPGGILALVTSHYTLDKQNAAIREYLGTKADFIGAIRLPSDAFKREGTSVVTDIVGGLAAKGLTRAANRPAEQIRWREVVSEAGPLRFRCCIQQPHQHEERHHRGHEIGVGDFPCPAVVRVVPFVILATNDDGHRIPVPVAPR